VHAVVTQLAPALTWLGVGVGVGVGAGLGAGLGVGRVGIKVRAGCAVAPTLTVARVGVDGTLEQRTAQREIRGRAGRALLVSKQRVRGKPCLGVGLGLGLGLGLGEGQSSQGWTATYHLLAADDLPIGLHTRAAYRR
jgi:hypothetical protein